METTIIDFFNFATTLWNDLRDVHHDSDDNTSQESVVTIDLEDCSAILSGLSKGLPLPFEPGYNVGSEIQNVDPKTNSRNVSRVCWKIVQDLLVHVKRVQKDRETLKTPAELNAAIRESWKKDDVDALGQRLRDISQKLDTETQEVLRTTQSFDLSNLSTLSIHEPSNEDLIIQKDTGEQIRDNDEASGEPSGSVSAKNASRFRNLPGTNVQALMAAQQKRAAAAPKPPMRASPGLLQDFILDGLSYKAMRDREEEVAEAHGSTFSWIFDENPLNKPADGRSDGDFLKWLSTSELGGIYWINGKAGSGKSTLLRYLWEHESTLKHLKRWAGTTPLAKAGFFFWTSGSEEQRSQTGLLRYLLHQLLDAERDMIEMAFPALWQRLQTSTTKERIKMSLNWSVPELVIGFQRLLAHALKEMKICLFIDGLDEFDGNHVEIIKFFRGIVQGPNGRQIKICLSSRPWQVFEDAFETTVPNLKLQDLTFSDMHHYVQDKLRQDIRVRRLMKHNPQEAENLTIATVKRADGVFLWVRLAVKTMLDHLQPGDTMLRLRELLSALPVDLDDLFEYLLFQTQTAEHLTDTSHIFQLIRAREVVVELIKDESATSLSVWEMAFALDKEDDDVALRASVVEAEDEKAAERCTRTRDRLLSRSVGLLEVYAKQPRNQRGPRFANDDDPGDIARNLAKNKVTYLHRTVRDYLMQSDDVWQRLAQESDPMSDTVFDPHLRLLRSYVLQLKMPLEEIEHHRRLDEWWPDIALSMTHSRCITKTLDPLHVLFLNELNDTISWYWLPRSSDPGDVWARNAFGSYETRGRTIIPRPFLSLATKFGLAEYVTQELESKDVNSDDDDDDDEEEGTVPLLTYATEFLCSRQKTIYPLSNANFVRVLFDLGQDPNLTYQDFNTRKPATPWLALLRHLRDARRRGWIEYYDTDFENGTARWTEVVSLFVQHGADVNAVVVEDRWDPEISALGVVDLLLDTYGAFEVQQLKDVMEEHGARLSGVQ